METDGLKVSHGAIVWVPKNKTYGFKLGWVKIDERKEQNGKGEK